MSTNDNIMPALCANCGKGEEESVALKSCVACKMVKYCSRDCQKAHRSQHKKECRKRAAELHDEALFKQPPQAEDCPICFLRLPSLDKGWGYMACCGISICSGCIHAGATTGLDQLCPFCRTPAATSYEENINRVKKRAELGNAQAIRNLGCNYDEGIYGLTQDRGKALELWRRAGELGNAAAYYNIGNVYFRGLVVERDEKKAIHYWELAATGGYPNARHNLGVFERNEGNMNRAMKHYMIAVESGYHDSLTTIKQQYTGGLATRDDYAKALKAYQAYLKEIKSDGRDKAAEFDEIYKYYE